MVQRAPIIFNHVLRSLPVRDKRRITGEVILVGVTVIWGATFSVTRGGLAYISPLLLISIRFLGSFIVAAPLLAMLGRRFWKAMLPGLLLGIFLSAGYSLQTIGLQYTTAARSAFVTYLFAVLVPPLQRLLGHRRLSIGNLLGLLVVIIGTAVLTQPWRAGGWNPGDLYTLGAAVAFALFIVLVDRFSRRHDPILFVPTEFLAAGLVSGIAAIVSHAVGAEQMFVVPNRELLLAVGFLALIGTVGALGIQTAVQSRTTPVRATTIYALEPVFAAGFGRLLLAERMTPIEITGAVVIVAGVLMSQLWGFLTASGRFRSG